MMGQKIQEVRIARGISQREFAERIGITPQHLSVIERGVKSPHMNTFIKILDELSVSADYILERGDAVADYVPKGLLDALDAHQRKTLLDIMFAYLKNVVIKRT